jgi:hypothetical protein
VEAPVLTDSGWRGTSGILYQWLSRAHRRHRISMVLTLGGEDRSGAERAPDRSRPARSAGLDPLEPESATQKSTLCPVSVDV